MANTVFGVYLCGATDCFLSAAFVDEDAAADWAVVNSSNPEGYMIKELSMQQVVKDFYYE